MANNITIGLKQELYKACEAIMQAKLLRIKTTITELQQSLNSETKSSAGDKHETGRAMVQLEREKLGQQLAEIQKTIMVLAKINVINTTKKVGLGAVVFTNRANYFIAISAGMLQVHDRIFYAISANTPIGQLLMGKSVGDHIVFKGDPIKIDHII
ncbi:3-oxoacyl-ACP synthase [Aestuariivivens sediminis]|uniref:3-oxoacyl-ACP synthase n=1 Tax=Aestuariivivens sediminis TaxID=2913557 RepID=UPI001F576BCA|nr:3-oxoacyl-ACP synthase [Aestuariivivens sediminis]